MEGTEQPPTWPPRPTVEDEPASDIQANTTSATERGMSDLPNGPSAAADGTNARMATPSTPANNGAETTPQNPEEPRTPVNAAPADPAVDRVQIVLKDQSGTQIAFGVKSNTRMEKVQNAYADRTGRPVGTLRFYYEGTRVVPEDTVATLEMENEDIIEVMTEQIGGEGGETENNTPEKVAIEVQECEIDGKTYPATYFSMLSHSKFRKLMKVWAEHRGCKATVSFYHQKPCQGDQAETRVRETDTPEKLGMGVNIILKAIQDSDMANTIDIDDDWVEMDGVSVKTEAPEKSFVLIVKYLGQDDISREMHCKMTHTMPFKNFIDLYAKRWNIDASAQRLTFNGKTVFPSNTPASIGAEHGAILNIAEDPNVFTMDLTLV
ncbi:hypothetical protein E4T50_00841 [Aureobasidium sp. EXF-12298]|nr:hypothetical protein E4T50_00841 [Aureobasidium sp. EXF-12298]KAI4772460.1 hypothetical protein E4T52_12572 [Aureobasidium sp. EXF-3400]